MAGLMHDVGRLAMLIGLPGYGATLARPLGDDGAAVAAEVARFGFDHAAAGGALLRTWGLPDTIVEAVRSHERQDVPRDAFAACIWLANRASHALGTRTERLAALEPWMVDVDVSCDELARLLDELVALESAQH
jgi:HD-like signal output (HDOD) protein